MINVPLHCVCVCIICLAWRGKTRRGMIANPGSKQPSNLIQRIRINSIFVRILPINCGRVCGMVCEFVKLLNNMHSLKEFCQPSDGSRSVVWTGMLTTFEWERERARERWCREQRWDKVMRFFFALAYSCYRKVDLIFVLFFMSSFCNNIFGLHWKLCGASFDPFANSTELLFWIVCTNYYANMVIQPTQHSMWYIRQYSYK